MGKRMGERIVKNVLIDFPGARPRERISCVDVPAAGNDNARRLVSSMRTVYETHLRPLVSAGSLTN